MEEIRLFDKRNFSGYCHKSLLPIGAVAEEQITRGTGETIYIGYRITEAGEKYGISLCVFSLEFGFNNGLSLYSVLGPTNSKGKSRSPLNRINILKLLRKERILRKADLVEKVGLNERGILRHLNVLQKIGFINYKAVPELHEAKGSFCYEYIGKIGEPEPVLVCKKLTKNVYGAIKQLEMADCNTLAEKLGYKYPQLISEILSGLEKQGFLKRVGEFKIKEIQSKAEILDAGRRFVDEYIAVIEEALSGGHALKELQARAEQFFANRNKVRIVLRERIENYWEVSPHGNARPVEETNERIIAYLEKHPGARPKDIEKDLGLLNSTGYLTPLVNIGILEKRKIDENNRAAVGYFVKKN